MIVDFLTGYFRFWIEVIPAAYHQIINRVKNEPNYQEYIILEPTSYGTWTIKRKSKAIILRDPKGEFSFLPPSISLQRNEVR